MAAGAAAAQGVDESFDDFAAEDELGPIPESPHEDDEAWGDEAQDEEAYGDESYGDNAYDDSAPRERESRLVALLQKRLVSLHAQLGTAPRLDAIWTAKAAIQEAWGTAKAAAKDERDARLRLEDDVVSLQASAASPRDASARKLVEDAVAKAVEARRERDAALAERDAMRRALRNLSDSFDGQLQSLRNERESEGRKLRNTNAKATAFAQSLAQTLREWMTTLDADDDDERRA